MLLSGWARAVQGFQSGKRTQLSQFGGLDSSILSANFRLLSAYSVQPGEPSVSLSVRKFAFRTRRAQYGTAKKVEGHRKLYMHASQAKTKKHTTAGIRWWSPTQLLTGRRVA